ncbi:zinc ribbon domain-containing protein [Desulfitobacterium sp. AusDCA]|uniref:zinc ribbon domain-containing protein n=1 Tax=Desulfitobacterium sp. AusDCA TaxID=3240383 RepID=UPI003DA6FA32
MRKFEEFINKLNFKKAALTYLVISGILLILCMSSIVYISRDKISMVLDYQRVSETFAREGVTDKAITQLQKLSTDSKDIKNVVVLDKDNTIVFKANNNLVGDKAKLQLIPYGAGSGYLQDSTHQDYLYKVVKPENMILNKDYIQNDQRVWQAVDDEMSYETDFALKEVYLLNYLMDRSTQSKVLMIRTATPIPYAERLIEATGALLGLIIVIYWIGLALWVYKDARSKGLNAALWGLLILMTNLVGFIVYLIYKQNNLTCYKCGALQSRFNSFCSHCGTEINESCPNCKAMINKGDHYCSRCGSKLD